MPEVNWELVERTLDWIEKNPTQHDQNFYAITRPWCGTTYCFAGAALMLEDKVEFNKDLDEHIVIECGNKISDFYKTGRDILGLTNKQADKIFYDSIRDCNWKNFDEFKEYVYNVLKGQEND